MSYTLDDFDSCLGCTGRDNSDPGPHVSAQQINRVIAAWGHGNEGGDYRLSDNAGTEWSGGFLCALKDGRFVYISGWCDYTGWG